ncbi:hypothetical protein BC628DRAFT_1418594 [Trametes gibbosa]|nr:hypothetical protein BC628DRAFT_1418594 [Trametes gibbosa]
MFGLEDLLQDAEYNLPKLLLVKYSGVASLAVLFLEYISTFEDEVKFIWPSRWSAVKIVFMVNRYSPFADVTLNVTLTLFATTAKSCQPQFEAMTSMYAVGSIASELILMARTLALYDFSNIVMGIMVALGLGIAVPAVIICRTFLSSVRYPSDDVIRITGCVPGVEDRSVWPLYMCVLISETVMVLLTLFKMWQTSDNGPHRSVLVRTMFRDGSLYYVVILSFSIANLCFMLLAPRAASPLRVIHATLCTRVLLNLRKVAARLSDLSMDDFRQSGIAFEAVSRITRGRTSYIDLEMDTLEDDYRYR